MVLKQKKMPCQEVFTENAGGYWACPLSPLSVPAGQDRHVVSMVLTKGSRFKGTALQAVWQGRNIRKKAQALIIKSEANLIKGSIFHFGHEDRNISIGQAPYDKDAAWQVTCACCDIGWYMHAEGGAPAQFSILLEQMGTAGLIFATRYPTGAKLKIKRKYGFAPDLKEQTLSKATKADFLLAPGDKYFIDANGTLFLKLVNEKASAFESGSNTEVANLFEDQPRYEITVKQGGGIVVKQTPPKDWLTTST